MRPCLKRKTKWPGMVAHTCELSTWEVKLGRPQFQGQPGLHSEILSQNKKQKQTNKKPRKGLVVVTEVIIATWKVEIGMIEVPG
jgi:hypothetical protein